MQIESKRFLKNAVPFILGNASKDFWFDNKKKTG